MKRAIDYKLGNVDVEVAEGIVVLSGNVPSQEARIEAERIAWSAPRVDKIGNEIQIKEGRSFIRGTKDGVLTSAVKTRLLADKAVKGRNINVETHDGIVYLLGVARNPYELAMLSLPISSKPPKPMVKVIVARSLVIALRPKAISL